MAKTAIATGGNSAKLLYNEKTFRESRKMSYFDRFMGGADSPVFTKTDLEKENGEKIRFAMIPRLTGQAILGSSGIPLEGNEMALTDYTLDVTLEQYRIGVRDDGALTRQRGMYDVSEESQIALKKRGAEIIDENCFTALQASPTTIVYGGDATSTATLETTDIITHNLISKVKALAKTGGMTGGAGTPAVRTRNPIEPVMVNGKAYYVLVVHPYALYDFKISAEYQQARREAEVRGGENPLFTGATAIWDGVVIHEHENINMYTNGGAGSNVPYCTGQLFGQQALVWAWGRRPKLVKKTFDYDNEVGYGWDFIAKCTKVKFNSLDWGSIGVYTALTNVG